MLSNININLISNKLKSFFESIYFILLISILTIINYQFNLGLLTYSLSCIFVSLMLLTKSNFTSITSIFIFLLAGGLLTPPNFKSIGFILTCFTGLILIISLIYYIIKNNKKILINNITNSFIITTILLVIIMLLSTITSVNPIRTIGRIGVFFVNILLMFSVVSTTENNDNNRINLANSLISIFYTLLVLIIFRIFRLLEDMPLSQIAYNKNLFHLGFALSNHYVPIMVIGSIASIYVILQKNIKLRIYQWIIYILPIILMPLVCIFLCARGSTLGYVCALASIYILFIIKNYNNKKIFYICISILLISILTFIILYINGIFDNVIDLYTKYDNTLNGREELWPVAIEQFKKHWFLGTGYGTQRLFIIKYTSQTVYNYHNYYLQISTCGILGIIVFTIYLINIFYHLIRKNQTYFDIFVSGVFVLFLTTGFFDTMFFSIKIMPPFSIIICFLEKKSIENKLEDKLLLKYELIDNN